MHILQNEDSNGHYSWLCRTLNFYYYCLRNYYKLLLYIAFLSHFLCYQALPWNLKYPLVCSWNFIHLDFKHSTYTLLQSDRQGSNLRHKSAWRLYSRCSPWSTLYYAGSCPEMVAIWNTWQGVEYMCLWLTRGHDCLPGHLQRLLALQGLFICCQVPESRGSQSCVRLLNTYNSRKGKCSNNTDSQVNVISLKYTLQQKRQCYSVVGMKSFQTLEKHYFRGHM